MRSGWILGSAVLGMAAAIGACGDGGSGSDPVTLDYAQVSGDAQSDTIGGTLDLPLKVVVTKNGSPLAGRTVQWAVTGGGGSVTAATSLTDGTGSALMNWKLGNNIGAQTATATVQGATGSPLSFSATATPGQPGDIQPASGDLQTGYVGTLFAVPFKVLVTDRADNPLEGAEVTWTELSGDLDIEAPTSTTDAQGLATVSVTAGDTAGPAQLGVSSGAVNTFFAVTVVTIDRQVDITAGGFVSLHNGTSQPAVDTVQAGQTVVWINQSGGSHSVRPVPLNIFQGSGTLTQGQMHAHTFNTPGTYNYNCAVHGAGEAGLIVVQ